MDIGRNDPCLCGSGKKYKKCCMKKAEVIDIKQVKLERFLEQKHILVTGLIDFLHDFVPFHEMNDLKKQFRERLGQHDENNMGLFYYWLIFFNRFGNGMRGIEWFISERQYKNQDELNLAKKWTSFVPRLIQAVEPQDTGAVVEDLFTGERLHLLKSDIFTSAKPWEGCFAMLEEFGDGFMINGVTMLEGPGVILNAKEKIQSIMADQKFTYTQTVFEFFPEIFSVFLSTEMRKMERIHEKTLVHSVATFKILNKAEICDFIFSSEQFHISEWKNEDGQGDFTGNWYSYEDNAAPGKVYLAEVFGLVEVKGDHLVFTGQEEELDNFYEVISPVKNLLSLVKKEDENIPVYQNIKIKSVILHFEGDMPESFGPIAQEQFLMDTDEPMPIFNDLSIKEMLLKNRVKEVEFLLREREYHSFKLLLEHNKSKSLVTSDYNTVRRKLGLPLSPFVTGGENRQSSIKNIPYPFQRPQLIIETDIPIYEALGFTSETARQFYGKDIFSFYKKSTDGKSAATRAKYEKGLEILVRFFEGNDADSWFSLKREDWEELLSYFYFAECLETSDNHAKSFISVLKSLTKWIDKKYGTSHFNDLSQLLTQLENQIYLSVYLLDTLVPYHLRKYANYIFHHEVENRRGTVGVYEVMDVRSSSIKVKDIKGRGDKMYSIMLSDETLEFIEPGVMIAGSIIKGNINAWEFETVERVFPGVARRYL
jgi:hypothetical protein